MLYAVIVGVGRCKVGGVTFIERGQIMSEVNTNILSVRMVDFWRKKKHNPWTPVMIGRHGCVEAKNLRSVAYQCRGVRKTGKASCEQRFYKVGEKTL